MTQPIAKKFRAIAMKVMDIRTVVYHPKIRPDKVTALKDSEELKQQYPNLTTHTVIQPSDPLWKDD